MDFSIGRSINGTGKPFTGDKANSRGSNKISNGSIAENSNQRTIPIMAQL